MIMKRLLIIAILVLVSITLITVVACGQQESARAGYKTYSRYSFSFEYPQSFLLFEQGLLESQANDTSGLVYAADENEEFESVFVGWIKAQEQIFDLEIAIEDGLQGMEGEGIASVERGELVETTKAGHRMLYQYYAATDVEGDKAFGIFGVWYCDKLQKLYMLYTMNTTISSKESVLRDYQSYLDYFVGH